MVLSDLTRIYIFTIDVDLVEGIVYDNDHIFYTYQPNGKAKLPAIMRVNIKEDKETYAPDSIKTLLAADAPRAIALHSCSG